MSTNNGWTFRGCPNVPHTDTGRSRLRRPGGKRPFVSLAVTLGCLTLWIALGATEPGAARPGARVVMDAHNCYPYFGWWADRIDRALSAGTPLAIEQDLFWYVDPRTREGRSVVAHSAPFTGHEPSMRDYFFERIRPVVEGALRNGDRQRWPLITLNLDVKSEEPEHLRAIWTLLTEYRDWLTSAERTPDITVAQPLDVRPVLVLTGESNAQKAVFHDQVPVSSRLLVFGATRTNTANPSAAPAVLAPDSPDNYHRWWNNAWRVIEPEGQPNAGDWSSQKQARLESLIKFAHQRGFWIRFYTLDGVSVADESCRGIFHSYNFGSLERVEKRWRAAEQAGSDYIATDQYEDLARELKHPY